MLDPFHIEEIPSLNRIEGQVRGIANMIDDDKYCIDILNQIKAVRNAITSVEGRILKKHMKECVREALSDENDFDGKVEEILKTLKR